MVHCGVAIVGVGRRLSLVRPCWAPLSQGLRLHPASVTRKLQTGFVSSRCHATDSGAADQASGVSEATSVSAANSSPFVLETEFRLYESRTDLKATAQQAYSKCMAGGVCGIVGFAGVLVGGSATMAPGIQGIICAGALGYAFKHFVISRRSLAGIAMRQVERITLLPSSIEGKAAPDGGAGELDDVESQLAAMSEVELKIETSNLDLWVKLTEPVAAWKGAKYSGFMADDRVSFGDLCQRGDLLHIEPASGWGQPGSPICPEPALLRALTATSKVVSERRVSCRTDVADLIKLPGSSAKLADAAFVTALKAPEESSRSALTKAAERPPPTKEMDQFAFSSIVSGVIFLAAGGLYVGKFLALDGSGKEGTNDPTVRDLLDNLKRRATGAEGGK